MALLYSSSEEFSGCVFATKQMFSGAWFALGKAPVCLNVTAEWLRLRPSAQAEQQGENIFFKIQEDWQTR